MSAERITTCPGCGIEGVYTFTGSISARRRSPKRCPECRTPADARTSPWRWEPTTGDPCPVKHSGKG